MTYLLLVAVAVTLLGCNSDQPAEPDISGCSATPLRAVCWSGRDTFLIITVDP